MESEWKKSVLTEFIDIKHGYAFKSVNFSEEETKYILLTPGNFNIGGGFSGNKLKYYKEGAEVPEEFILNAEDLIITMTDLSKDGDTLGYPAIVPSIKNKILLHNQRLGKVIIKYTKLIDTNFLYYLFCTEQYRQEVLATSTGTTVKHTAPKRILSFEFLLPPFKEQESIANILSSLDSKILLNNQMNKTLELIAQTLFKRWFIDFEFPDENGNPYKSSGGRMVDSELGEIPEGWEVCTLKEVCKQICNGGTPSRNKPEYWENGTINWIKTKELSDTIILDSEERINQFGLGNSAAKLLEPGTIVIAIYAAPTVGRLGILGVPAATNQACTALLADKSKISHYHIYYSLLYLREYLNSISSGSAQQNISKLIIEELKIVVPSLDLISKSYVIFDCFWKKIENNLLENSRISQIRDSLLPKLMSGKIRIEF